ncbi:M23 family metallopeptidase [Leifsonia sp. A12D58]|uniref:M23 family metallopeptidase n=1 Tax=Leifsonia sp. A12D58 TaxID=3397674 RepID=UPI0039E1C1B2
MRAAQAAVAKASAAYNAAKVNYASAKAEYDAAGAQSGAIHTMLAAAELRADTSKRLLAGVVRALMQQDPAAGAAAILLGGETGADLLSQLGTLDSLSRLAANLDTIKDKVAADEAAAESLRSRETNTDGPLNGVALEKSKNQLDAAKASFELSTTRLASVQTAMSAALDDGPLPLLPADAPWLNADAGQLSGQGWANPAVGNVSDGFGPRPDLPLPDVGVFHYGTDIGAACGAGIYAATSGVVVEVSPLGTYGNWILIDHGNGVETGYAHIMTGSQLVTVGDSVIAGQVIAGVGSTGASTGCHLHFEVRIDGTRIDSVPFMTSRGITVGG